MSPVPESKNNTGTSLWHRLGALGVRDVVVNGSIRRVGVPDYLFEDARQDAAIQLFTKPASDEWSDGECVNCAKRIAYRAALNLRRTQEKAAVIPKDIYGERPRAAKVAPDLETVAWEIWQTHHDNAEHDRQTQARTRIDDDSLNTSIERRLDGLSSTHRRVARAIIAGESLSSAASRLDISEESASRYVSRILVYLGRSDLVVGVVVAALSLWLCFFTTAVAVADDLGKRSRTYEISEPDIRAVMLAQLARLDLEQKGAELADRAKDYTGDLQPIHLPPMDETKTHYVRFTTTLEKDFYVPLTGDDGKLDWQLIAPAGTELNTLDYIRPVTAFLVIDATSAKQRRFGVAALKAAPRYIKLLVSAGDPADIAKKIATPVYRASPWLLRRFHVVHTPVLIRPGYGQHASAIAVTALGVPWTVDALRRLDPLKPMTIAQARKAHFPKPVAAD